MYLLFSATSIYWSAIAEIVQLRFFCIESSQIVTREHYVHATCKRFHYRSGMSMANLLALTPRSSAQRNSEHQALTPAHW